MNRRGISERWARDAIPDYPASKRFATKARSTPCDDGWRRALFDPAPLFLLGASTAVRLATGFVDLKYLALQFGPGPFGVLTQVMGVAAIFYTFAGGGTTTGLIRNISLAGSKQEHNRWMSTGATINVLSSAALAGLAIALALFGGG